MNYTITGNPAKGYAVEFSRVWPRLSVCPCCNKPIETLRKAFLMAENLWLIAEGVEPWTLNAGDSAAFVDTISSAPEPNAALKDAAARYKGESS